MASTPREASARAGGAGTAVRTGRAVVMVGKEFQIREYEVPEPAPGTLLLRQEPRRLASWISGNVRKKMGTLALMVSGSLALIAGLHLYWAFGGSWGARVALPKKEDGSLLFSLATSPSRLAHIRQPSALATLSSSRVRCRAIRAPAHCPATTSRARCDRYWRT